MCIASGLMPTALESKCLHDEGSTNPAQIETFQLHQTSQRSNIVELSFNHKTLHAPFTSKERLLLNRAIHNGRQTPIEIQCYQ